MKTIKTMLTIVALATTLFTIQSCKESKKEVPTDTVKSEMNHDNMNSSDNKMDSNTQNPDVKLMLADYMTLKDALVATNKEESANAGKKLESSLSNFNVSSYTAEQQKELNDIITDAKEHAEHIGKSEMSHQREHFKVLSKNMIDMMAITGTNTTLYQQFCPMYDGGSAWLSMNKDIKNPYFGSKMMTCGKVQKVIN